MPHEHGQGASGTPQTPEGIMYSAYELLNRLNPVEDAAYDSATSHGWRYECSPNTCVSAMDGLRSWAHNPDPPAIQWIYGASGAGKTTLAYTCCKELDDDNRLGASFFCTRAFPKCRDVWRIIPTIAYQLACYSHAFHSSLLQILQDNPDCITSDLDTQFQKLIRAPLLESKHSLSTSNQLVVLIDGIDECEDVIGAQTILGVSARHIPHLPIKFLVTSGPGLVTMAQNRGMPDGEIHLYHLDQSRLSVQTDIMTHLAHELDSLLSTKDQISGIAKHAKGSFIYATTCVRYMWSTQLRAKPSKLIQTPSILDVISKPVGDGLSALDKLYMSILTSISESSGLKGSEVQAAVFALKTVICARSPMSIDTLSGLLRTSRNQLLRLLSPLLPFLHVSRDGTTVLVLHQSFCVFMLNQYSGKFHCDIKQQNQQLALRCLEIMKGMLRFNMCDREISYALDSDIPGFFDRADRIISCELLHACRYWGYYVENAAPLETLCLSIDDFLSNRLLHWMEALNLKQLIHEGLSTLSRVQKWLRRCCPSTEIHELMQDALSFFTSFADSSASQSTLQIYIFALPTWPKTNPVSRCYWEGTHKILQSAGLPVDVNSALLSTWSTGASVLSIAVSLDGTRVLSSTASFSQALGLWDSDSGNHVNLEAITGHQDCGVINSIAFSRDGSYIASGSRAHITSTWGIGETQVPEQNFQFEDHFGPVNSVALSPNNTLLASGSDDCSVRIWPLSRSTTALPGDISPNSTWHCHHTRPVRSVAFSPDGALLASGSNDYNICVMDTQSGRLAAHPITGHTDSVNSVAFSPNGCFIVSGSSDCTIRLWDVPKKFIIHRAPIKGHTESINSVMFSPDGTCLVSGSSDLTIRICDVRDGQMKAGPFLGHIKPINAVVFTPDGTRIISGSEDQTIRVWGAEQAGLYMQFPSEDDSARVGPAVQPSGMTAIQMLECLVEHGCLDLTSAINQQATSSGWVTGGSFGDIYSGKLHNGTDIAIKVLRFANLTEDKRKSLKRAMREIYGWSKLNHKNIHKLLGVTVHQGRLGMVSRWMEHGNLREYIHNNPTVDHYQLCIQVAVGLQYLHSMNMVHGDLKAGNILVSQDGVAKLTDFDHLIMSDCSLKFSETTRVGGGTLRWMAPELVILDPSHQRNKRTDVYALGMTLLEIVTGSVPYAQCTENFQVISKLMAKILPERPDHFDQNAKGDKMWALLVRCWNHDPDARPIADEVHDSLRRLTNGSTLPSLQEG